MKREENCVFCKIVRGKAAAVKVYEDESTMAFMDINPSSPGHTLVVCKQHFENLLEIEPDALQTTTLTVQRLAQAINRALAPDGLRIGQFNGAAAGQSVFHYHVHIAPRWHGQQAGMHGRERGDMAAIEKIAEKIRAAL